MKRREFFKKIGLATGVAVCAPLVVNALISKPEPIAEAITCGDGWVSQMENSPIMDYDKSISLENLEKIIKNMSKERCPIIYGPMIFKSF